MNDNAKLRPGTLLRWDFNVGNGSWPNLVVTEDRRSDPWHVGTCVMVQRNDLLMMVATEDLGPAQPTNLEYDDIGMIVRAESLPLKRWCIVMWHDKLLWMPHDNLNNTKLVCDA